MMRRRADRGTRPVRPGVARQAPLLLVRRATTLLVLRATTLLVLVSLSFGPRPAEARFLHSLIRRLGGNNTCQPKAMKRCKPEVEVWHDKPYNHPPIPNGCGSRDLPVRLAKHGDFKPCCDEHDICYATCGRSKSECDEAFHVCMSAHCHAEYLPRGKRRATHLQRCLGEASLYYSGVVGLGCGSYKRAQLKHCTCRLAKHVVAASDEAGGFESNSDSDSDSDSDDEEEWDEDWEEEEFDLEEREEWEKEWDEWESEEGDWSEDELDDDDEEEDLAEVEVDA